MSQSVWHNLDSDEVLQRLEGIDKLTNESGLEYHNKWWFSMDRGLESPH